MATPGPVLGRHPAREANHGGAALVVLGAGALAGYLYWRDHQGGGTTPVPCSVCQDGCAGPCVNAARPTGLYQAADGALYWVNGCRRWGVPSATQQARCFAGLTPTVMGNNFFGNADQTPPDWIMTVGDVTACTVCPPGSPGA